MSEQCDNESELEDQEEKEKKASIPLTKSGIEDLPSTVITSICCADGQMDNVPDEAFAWKKAPPKVKQPKLKGKAPGAPNMKTGDSKQVLKTKTDIKLQGKGQNLIKTKKVQATTSKDSLAKVRNSKLASDSKPIVGDKKGIRGGSSTQIKQHISSRLKLKSRNAK